MNGLDLATGVSTGKPYLWNGGNPVFLERDSGRGSEWCAPSTWKRKGKRLSVLALDFGIKYNILRCLEDVGCEVLVCPADTAAEEIRELAPDGIFLSNGPGDPEPVTYAVETIRKVLEYRPVFGICLGHQLLGLALGGATYKLKFGHRGANQPVKNLRTGRVEITSQNHGFAVDQDSLPKGETEVTHINLNDFTVEGVRHKHLPVSSVQYHPEAGPGPHDARYLFSDFIQAMQGR